MAKKEGNKEGNHLYIVVVSVVAVVAIVALVLNSGSLSGAPVYVPSENAVDVCVDTDPDNNRFAKGSAQVGVAKYYDYCLSGQVHQYKCKSGSGVVAAGLPTTCAKGCENGACLP